MQGNGQTEFSVSYEAANDLSLMLLHQLDSVEDQGLREVATAMTLARLTAWPKILTVEEEGPFIGAVLDLSTSFWTEGEAN